MALKRLKITNEEAQLLAFLEAFEQNDLANVQNQEYQFVNLIGVLFLMTKSHKDKKGLLFITAQELFNLMNLETVNIESFQSYFGQKVQAI